MMKKARFSRDFILVVIGQIISLFGNAALRFAIPLYLLNQTGSSVLYGTVTACAFLPSIVMSPIGGIVADRVNKRTIMVVLDFFTAALTIFVSIFLEQDGQIFLLAGALMLLYGICYPYLDYTFEVYGYLSKTQVTDTLRQKNRRTYPLVSLSQKCDISARYRGLK